MNENHRENLSIFFSLIIIVMAGWVIREFMQPLIWAGILALATWPIYDKVHRTFAKNDLFASMLMMTLVLIVVVAPLIWLVTELARDIQWLTKFLMTANQQGVPLPLWITELPFGKDFATSAWMTTLGTPKGLSQILSHDTHGQAAQITSVLRSFGSQLAHRGLIFGFTLLCLFFFYKDGIELISHINAMGRYFLGERWALYSANLPGAINATVNGLVLVGICVGIIMGIVYAVAGAPAPALLGFITAILAMIPFAVPFAFLLVAVLLVTSSKVLAAISVVAIGTAVMFITDHFVRPVVIGGATQLPFLAVLFGILGGVKTFGVVGLFLGPIVMVLFITLWHEADIFHERCAHRLDIKK